MATTPSQGHRDVLSNTLTREAPSSPACPTASAACPVVTCLQRLLVAGPPQAHAYVVLSLAEQLMTLLIEDAPVDVFETILAEAAQAAGDEAELAAVRRQIDVSIRLRALLERYKRRTGVLAALYETAGDLASLRDVEKVLHAIVRRSRQLLQTDVAYLMLIDEERGDTYMRVTDGTVTPDFLYIRLALGVGLGGVVAQTAEPHWTDNYLEDKRYLHVIDEIVDEERLIAILGVPLKVGRRLMGVLFAADRHPRSFAQEEVSLLSSLGAHAAIAIENASLLHETQVAVTRLTEAKGLIEEHSEALERASVMHERLTNLVLAGGDASELACTVAGALRGALLVLGADGRVTARAGTDDDPALDSLTAVDVPDSLPNHDPARAELRQLVARLVREAAASRRSTQAPTGAALARVAPVIAGADHLGSLLFVGPELGEADTRALERAATVTALLWLNQRARDEAENRVRGELLAELLRAPVGDAEAVRRRAELVGVDLGCPLTVMVAVTDGPAVPARVQSEAMLIARDGRGLVTTYGGSVVLLLPGQDEEHLSSASARRLNDVSRTHVTVGAVGPIHELAQLPDAERQARRCAKALVLLGREGQSCTPRQLGVYGLLLSEAGREQVQDFLSTALGPLERYDAQRGTALIQTIDRYFEHDGHVAHAAKSLFVHPNTLYQRLERVDGILGEGWRHGDRALEVRLALRLRRLGSSACSPVDRHDM